LPAAAQPDAGHARPATVARPTDGELRALVLRHAQERAEQLGSGTDGPDGAQRRDVGSFTDPESDTVRIETSEDGSSETVTVEPRSAVDLLTTGIDLGPTEVSFTATTAAPPPSGGGLDEVVFVDWVVDVDGDGNPEAVVSSFGGEMEAGAVLFNIVLQEDGGDPFDTTCTGDATLDGSTHRASGFPLGCLGADVRFASIAVSATSFEPETGAQFFDSAPDAPPRPPCRRRRAPPSRSSTARSR